jgi:hypothetical protein
MASSPSILDSDAFARDCSGGHPAVDATPVVANLKPLPLDGLDHVQVLPTADLAQDDVANLKGGRLNRLDRA